MKLQPAPASGRHIIETPWIRWTLLVAAWGIFGLFMATEWYIQAARAGNPILWRSALMSEMVYASVWLLLTPPILWLAWRFPFHASNWLPVAAIHLTATLLFSVAHRVVFSVASEVIALSPDHPFLWSTISASVYRYFDYGIMIYWILLLFRQSIGYYRQVQQQALKRSELESELNLAQLRALKMQLQPHFLFNTLNGISVLVRKNPDAACAMISRLADLLRMTLDNTGTQEIPLHQELKTLACYLDIERMRFADRLSVTMDIDEETKNAFVPNLILQPLVENALVHGVAKQRSSARLSIKSSRTNGSLTLEVEDSGPGLPGGSELREGIGMSNTRSRLERLYGNEFSFGMEHVPGSGAIARITMPYHTSPRE